MKFYAVRHGKTTWNIEGRILGTTPGELAPEGEQAAIDLVTKIQDLQPDIVYVSDLQRAKQTIAPTITSLPNLNVEFTKQLRERDFGELEGQLYEDVDWDGFWKLPPDSTAYNAERLKDFTNRIAQFVMSIADGNVQTVLTVSHIGVMNRFNYLENPNGFVYMSYPNTEIMHFDYNTMYQNARDVLAD